MNYDYLIVGAGFTGCVLAERLATELKKSVLLIDRAAHLGGLMYDFVNDDGILVHGCGLHVFHTNSAEVFEYLSQFTEWTLNPTKVGAFIEGKHVSFPLNRKAINDLFDLDLKTEEEVAEFVKNEQIPNPSPKNAEEMALSQVGPRIYEKLFKGYTLKWWNRDPKELDPRLTSKLVVRGDLSENYQADIYQGVPSPSYANLFEKLTANPLITVKLNQEFPQIPEGVTFDRMIYTGAPDQFFNYRHGRLPYRTMDFQYETFDQEYVLPTHQVVYPDQKVGYMRIFEFKHATQQKHPKTTVIKEFPRDSADQEISHFPIPTESAQAMYQKYQDEMKQLKNVHFIGRLPSYRYFTMGQTVARALTFFKNSLAQTNGYDKLVASDPLVRSKSHLPS